MCRHGWFLIETSCRPYQPNSMRVRHAHVSGPARPSCVYVSPQAWSRVGNRAMQPLSRLPNRRRGSRRGHTVETGALSPKKHAITGCRTPKVVPGGGGFVGFALAIALTSCFGRRMRRAASPRSGVRMGSGASIGSRPARTMRKAIRKPAPRRAGGPVKRSCGVDSSGRSAPPP